MKDKRIHFYAILMVMFFSVSAIAAPGVFRFLTSAPLPDGTKNTNYNTRMVVANANGAVTFSIVNNPDPLPTGLSLDGQTGYITGIPDPGAGGKWTFIVRATDDVGLLDLPTWISISASGGGGSPAVYFTTTVLPNAKVGTAYGAVTFTDDGDWVNLTGHGLLTNQAVTFSAITGGTVTTITPGTAYYVRTAGGPDKFNLSEAVDGTTMTFTTTESPASTMTIPLTVSGGAGPFVFMTSGLPLGLSLDGTTGVISGTPSESGTFFVTMTARDTNDDTKTVKVLPLTVLPSTSLFRFTTLVFDNGELLSEYEDTYATQGGLGPVTYTATGLPPGLTLTYDPLTDIASVTGTPTTAGTYLVTVKANDGDKTIVIQQQITITPPALSKFYWNFLGLPSATINTNYTNQPPVLVAAVNKAGAVTYSVTGLPAGISYNAGTGELTGTPTGPIGVYPLVFSVTDAGPPVTITMNADLVVMGPNGGDSNSIAAQFFVTTQTFKSGVPDCDSWSATIIYNADRTMGKAFNPDTDNFTLNLGDAEISLVPGDLVKVSPVLYTYQSSSALPVSTSVKIYADKQQIKIKTSHDTLTDTVPNELLNSLTLGSGIGRIKEYIEAKGKFKIFTGYRNTGFVVSKAKLTRVGVGQDSAQLQLYLASPGFSYTTGDTVTIRLLDDTSAEMLNKDATALITGTQKVDSATQATVYSLKKSIADVAVTNKLMSFKYDNKKGKMDIKLSCLDLSLLTEDEENLTVEITIGNSVYTTTLTIFDPDGLGKYTEKMPIP